MQEFESWLVFSKRERIGIFTLAALIILVTIIIRFAPERTSTVDENDLTNYIQQMDSLFLKEKENTTYTTTPKKKPERKRDFANSNKTDKSKIPISRDSLLTLNPNEASVSELIKIGIPLKVANTLNRFRSKGGRLYKPQDILKIYGMTESIFMEIKDQLIIPQQKKEWKEYDSKPFKKEEREKIIVEINLANKDQLMSVNGIGPYYADKIIRYRDELGGYYALEQIIEIEKLNDSIFQRLKPSLELSPIIEKRDLNAASLREIMYHPYFSKQQARQILTHRDFNLKLRSWKELENLLKITPKEVEKIQAYFDIR